MDLWKQGAICGEVSNLIPTIFPLPPANLIRPSVLACLESLNPVSSRMAESRSDSATVLALTDGKPGSVKKSLAVLPSVV